MGKILKVLLKRNKVEKMMSNDVKLGDPVMIIPVEGISKGRRVDLSGIVVELNGKDAVVVWSVPGLGLESVVPTSRLVTIVN